jgi:phage/plasmid-like protein (TIGR03299 family)
MSNEEFEKGLEKTKMLEHAGLNWTVRHEGLKTDSGIVVPKKIALIRDDTNTVLGTHAVGYETYQNYELLDLLHRIGKQTGLTVQSGGLFKGGEKVWFQLKSNDLVLPNDRIEGYISGLNSFSGVTSLAFGHTKKTISCQNSWWTAYREVATRVRHSSLMRPKIEEILKQMDVLLNEEKNQFEEIKRLGEVRMTAEVQELITKKLFEIKVEDRLDTLELSTRMKNNIDRFNHDLHMELLQKGDSLWGLFNGVTRYTTHSMKSTDNSESKMFGRTGKLEREIYSELVEMI